MSVKRIHPETISSSPEIVQAIAEELRLNRENSPEDAPEIIEEELAHSRSLFVTVLWDAWQHLSGEARGRAIMEAYRQVRPDEVLNISLALGLTHA